VCRLVAPCGPAAYARFGGSPTLNPDFSGNFTLSRHHRTSTDSRWRACVAVLITGELSTPEIRVECRRSLVQVQLVDFRKQLFLGEPIYKIAFRSQHLGR
jgi:hypothetical protein